MPRDRDWKLSEKRVILRAPDTKCDELSAFCDQLIIIINEKE